MENKVSIIVPTKDRPVSLVRAVRSALLSKTPSIEVIVVDDNSKISAKNVLTDITDTRLKIYKLDIQTKSGPAAARNYAVAKSSGTILLFLDDDDELISNYIENILNTIESNPNVSFGYCSFIVAEYRNNSYHKRTVSRCKNSRNFNFCDGFKFMKGQAGFGMGFWIKTKVFFATGEINENLTVNEDTDYFLRLLANERTGWYCASPRIILNQWKGNKYDLESITKLTKDSEKLRCLNLIYQNNLNYINRDKSAQFYIGSHIARLCLRENGILDTLRAVKKNQSSFVRILIHALLIKLLIRSIVRYLAWKLYFKGLDYFRPFGRKFFNCR